MPEEQPKKFAERAKAFGRDTFYGIAQKWAQRIVEGILLILLLGVVVLIAAGGEVPAASLAVALLIFGAALFALRRYYLGQIKAIRTTELRDKKKKLELAEDALDRHDSYDNHMCRVMDYFQRVLANDLKIPMEKFIEAGILVASRDVMIENGHDQDLRLSVLMIDGENFRMVFAAGHDLQSQQKYCVPVADTLGEVTLKKRLPQVWKDVREDRLFKENPNATRPFTSMISVPIFVGDKGIAVFNAITDRKDAFDATDVSCFTSLGMVVQAAFGVWLKDRRRERRTKLNATKRRAIRGQVVEEHAPPKGVGLTESPDREETSDE